MVKKPRDKRPELKVVGEDEPRERSRSSDTPKDDAEPSDKEGADAVKNRDDELLDDEKLVEQVREAAKDAAKGFENQWERDNDQMDYWDIYDQVIGGKQSYAGNHTVYLPIVKQAIEARVTRFVNQVFPRSGRNIDVISTDDKPYDLMALLEHYIRKTRLRTQICPALVRNGDVEGQYNIYVSWTNSSRFIVEKAAPTVEIETSLPGEEQGQTAEVQLPQDDLDEEDYDLEEVETFHMHPTVEVLPDCDVLVTPHTAASVGDAIEAGGLVAIIRRWTKGRLQQAIDDGEIDEKEGERLIDEFSSTTEPPGQQNVAKKHLNAVGIQTGEGGKVLIFYEIWRKMKVDGERRLVRAFYAGGDGERAFSVRRNPYWCDKVPLISAPLKKIAKAFKGQSEVKAVADLQYAANDFVNEGFDSADYALMPIVMTDPTKNPRVGSMVLNLAAIWETNPNDTKFAQMPALWKDALTMVSGIKNEIFQILSVSPAMLPQQSGGKAKRNQAEIAMEQQIDVMATADVCTNLEDEVLTPLLRWFVDLDYQYRDKKATVRQYGQMGLKAAMQEVPVLQNSRRFEFRWFGVEAARATQMIQVQTSAINVVKGIPPQMYDGFKLRLAPFISQLLENAFGSRLVPQLWESIKDKLSMNAEMENEFLIEGLTLPVHELDDDQEHMKEHLKALVHGDPSGSIREHMLLHRTQMSMKLQQQAAGMAQMQGGAPGGPGQPGVGGTPRPGAQGQPPRGGQQPPGAIHADRLAEGAPRR